MNDPQLVNLSVDNPGINRFISVNLRSIFVLLMTKNTYSVLLF